MTDLQRQSNVNYIIGFHNEFRILRHDFIEIYPTYKLEEVNNMQIGEVVREIQYNNEIKLIELNITELYKKQNEKKH